jgi:protein-S-isoprenylcysteine O-methyltransferase Ste14
MALIEELDRSGSWLFRWRSFMPLVLYFMAALVIFLGQDVHMEHFDLSWSLICLGIAMLGQFIRAVTIGHTPKGTSGRNTKEGQVAEVLNTKGIYSVVRHPLYLGNFFMWLGIIMYVGNWWFTAVCCLLYWLYYERIMFTEEYFLRHKFGQSYLQWSEKVPAFWPRLTQWTSSDADFSMRNVLKREYSGFFAVFLSFALVDAMKNYVRYEYTDWRLVDPFWQYAFAFGLCCFVLLRSLKKYTNVLNVAGREFM